MENNVFEETKRDLIQSVDARLKEKDTDRNLAITYAPAFREWMPILKLHLQENYQVISLNTLLGQSEQPKSHIRQSPIKTILSTIFLFILGLLPRIGIIISGTQTLIEVARTSYSYYLKNSDLELLKDQLGLRLYRKRYQRKLKQIVFIPEYGVLSSKDQRYVRFLSYLVQNRYLFSTALIIGRTQSDICPISFAWEKDIPLQNDMIQMCLGGTKKTNQISEILNIIGIGYLPMLQKSLSKENVDRDLLESLVNTLLDQVFPDGIIDRDEFHHFMRLCSLLFEPFFQEDIEDNYPVRQLPADELVGYALKCKLLTQVDSAPIFRFIEYFIRDYYRNSTIYTFPTEIYRTIFNYLKNKYPCQYADIALLSVYIGIPTVEVESYSIVAWYHESDSLPQRKKEEIIQILLNGPHSHMYYHLYEIYCQFEHCFDSMGIDSCVNMCQSALLQMENSQLNPEAKCCYLSIISAIAFEVSIEESLFLRILDNYFSAFKQLRLFSNPIEQHIEYAVDALLLSAGLELPYNYRNRLERLAARVDIKKNIPELKRLRLLRLGNIIFSPARGHEYTKMAYEQSINYPHEHILSAINYSASLLSKAYYSEAQNALEHTSSSIRTYHINSNTEFSYENNWIIARVMSGAMHKSAARREFKRLYSRLKKVPFSDSMIVQNNYAAAIIFSAAKTYQRQAQKILFQIMDNQDLYHQFFAIHNLLILYCLMGEKDAFLQLKPKLQIPYLLRRYRDFFCEKFNILQEKFDNCQSLQQIEINLQTLGEQFPELEAEFYRLPVLWGVIERWFE